MVIFPGVTHATNPRIAVVGSANLDIVIELEAAPIPGQTVLGTGYSEHGGGKGQNQAIASARLVPTVFIGALGSDAAGDLLADNMQAQGVEVASVPRSELPSGRAFITLTPDAENSIVVIAGASAILTGEQVTAALEIAQPDVVITQQEISAAAVDAAAAWARGNGRRFLLNASPVRRVSPLVLATADPLIVNVDEARDILDSDVNDARSDVSVPVPSHVTAVPGDSPADPERAVAEALLKICRSVIVTAGKRGAYLASRDGGVEHVDAQLVSAVDTTGAGDEFAGTVAASLAMGESLRSAAERASAASARLVQLQRAAR